MEEQEEILRERTLTVINYGTDDEEELLKTRVTLAPSMIVGLIASYDTALTIDGLELRKVNVILTGGDNIELFITVLELTTLERAIGAYFLAD